MSIHQTIASLLKDVENPVYLEAGIHYGEDTQEVASLIYPLRIIGIEPDERNADVVRTLPLYQIMEFYEVALGAYNGTGILYMSSGNEDPDAPSWTGSSSIARPKDHLKHFPSIKFEDTCQIDVVTLDALCRDNNIDKIDFFWCDAQGSELHIIKGGQKALRKTHYLYFEHYGNTEMYEGQGSLDECLEALPGKWHVLERFPNDILVENLDFKQNV